MFEIREQGDIRILDVKGDLDNYGSADLLKEMEQCIKQQNYKLIVNLEQVSYINSTAISGLVRVAKQVRQKRGDLKLFGLAVKLQRTFDLVGASKVVEIYNTEADAIASF